MRHLWLPLGGLLLATFGIAAIIVWYNDTLLVGRSNNREPCRGRPTAECWSFPAEQMYSDPTITLYTMWTMFGVALGVATIGVGTILIARPRAEVAQKQAPPKEHA